MGNLICKIFFLTSAITAVHAQEEKNQYIHHGLLRAQTTISPGYMLKERVSTVSIHGNIEYYVAENVSIRGDGYYFIQVKDKIMNPFDFNHSVFSGASWHIKTKSHFDPYFAFQPGIAVSKKRDILCGDNPTLLPCFDEYYKTSFNPGISSVVGFNFYFQRWFHLFAEIRYIDGRHLSDAPSPLSLSELKFSFGLGWNLNLLKKKD